MTTPPGPVPGLASTAAQAPTAHLRGLETGPGGAHGSYLDAASATPLHPVAREALLSALDDGWADPRRLHHAGRRARLLLDSAREAVADVLGARADEVSFTSSGTTAVHLGLLGLAKGRRRVGNAVVASAVEHSSVLHAADAAGERREVGVDSGGTVDLDAWSAAVAGPGVALACLQSANHEVGTVQPVAEAAQACARAGVPLLVDAAQSVGRVAVPDGWSVLTASARKWGGPPGVGVLAVRTGARWRATTPADEHEAGRVPGAVALPWVLAAAAALQAAAAEAASEGARQAALVEVIRREVPRRVPDVEVVGHPTARLPHLVTFSCLYADGEALVRGLDAAGFAVSSGSSCTSSTLTPSHVLVAMGALTHGNVRVSLHRGVTAGDVDRFLNVLPGVVEDVRRAAGAVGL